MQKTLILAALGVLLCAASAQAQTAPAADETAPPKPLTIKLGALFPSNGNLKDLVGSTFFSAGAEYAFLNKQNPASLVPLVYVDYAGRGKNRSIDDGQGNSVSLDLTASTVGVGGGARYYIGTPGTGSVTPYVGAGVGVYFNRIKVATTISSGGQSGSASDSLNKTQFGFRLNAGVEFQKMYLLEANYTNAGSVEGTRIDGFGIQAGVRF